MPNVWHREEIFSMQESVTVENEVQEENAPTVEPTPNPAEQLEKLQAERIEWEKAQRELRQKLDEFEKAENELHRQLATNQVRTLFKLLDGFAELFKTGPVAQTYQRILDCLESIKHHDPDVKKNLASNVYVEIVKGHPHFSFWLQIIQRHLITANSLEKCLGDIFPKVHETPFEKVEK